MTTGIENIDELITSLSIKEKTLLVIANGKEFSTRINIASFIKGALK